jgi:hypothetical protein
MGYLQATRMGRFEMLRLDSGVGPALLWVAALHTAPLGSAESS